MTKIKPKVVSYGEVLWDKYQRYRKLGGAPFNVLGHLQQLGAETFMISRIGKDNLGSEILSAVDEAGVNRTHVQEDKSLPTGVVNVLLDNAGKPSYEIVEPVAWDAIELEQEMIDLVKEADLLVHGSLAARSRQSRSTLINLISKSSSRVFDMNLRQDFYSKELLTTLIMNCSILKVNDEEFNLLTELLGVKKDSLYGHLFEKYNLNLVVQTKGADGAEVYDGHKIINHPGYPIEVVDTVGSGDAFLAGFLYKYLSKAPIIECLDTGCKLGAYVATKEGAIPLYDKDFLGSLST